MTKSEIIEMLRSLSLNQQGVIQFRSHGICSLLKQYGEDDILVAFYQCLPTWKHYTGNRGFPVPSQDYLEEGDYYLLCKDKWVGPYGDLRRDLCRHFADYLEKQNEIQPRI